MFEEAFHVNPSSSEQIQNASAQLRLQGLEATQKYRLKEINLFPGTKSFQPDHDKVFTGDYLMNIGLHLSGGRTTPLTSTVYEIRADQLLHF